MRITKLMLNKRYQKMIAVLLPYSEDIFEHPNFLLQNNFIQHGDTTVLQHVITVAFIALLIKRKLKIKCDERRLVRGALLHDYFLYDWHLKDNNPHPRLHGFYHPGIAKENAIRDFNISKKEQDIIAKHMWPLTIVPPSSKEAWLVTLADKYVSSKESIGIK